jgi:hypothetical protein
LNISIKTRCKISPAGINDRDEALNTSTTFEKDPSPEYPPAKNARPRFGRETAARLLRATER